MPSGCGPSTGSIRSGSVPRKRGAGPGRTGRLAGPARATATRPARRPMRAVTIEDGKLAIREHPDPVPGTGELLVRVRAAGLNGADMHQLRGGYPAPPGSPADIPGLDLAGRVVATGPNVTRFGPGDRVMAVVGGGAQAERVLVHGAAGGVGSAGVQLAATAGALVTATVRNLEHHRAVADLGAERVLTPDELPGSGPFDVILELVGAPNFPGNLDELATRGRISIIGTGAGGRIELDLRMLMVQRAQVLGSTLRSRPLEQKADAARRVEAHVLPAVAAGRVRVPVAATYPLDQAEQAYERFRAGGKLGKIVLEP